jgi:hypothetical protein
VTYNAKGAASESMSGASEEDKSKWLEVEVQDELRRITARKEAGRLYEEQEAQREAANHPEGRWMDLDEYLDGEYVAPTADLGAWREDRIQFLYPGKWHTMIGLTTAGKTFWALWQAKAVMEDGGHVVYVHFEESNPAGTIARLLHMGADREMIRKQFHWPRSHSWARGEMAEEIERLRDKPALAVLDGINAACGAHGWDVNVACSVGAYRSMFVYPLTEMGCAVLSLGHPVKNPGRQGESYSYGAAGWLNDVDGVSYRLKSSDKPISRGKEGRSWLYSVKDRYGEVERWGVYEDSKDMPWYFQGGFYVDDTETGPLGVQHLKVTVPSIDPGAGQDKIDVGCQRVVAFLKKTSPNFKSQNDLHNRMAADPDTTPPQKGDMPVILQRLLDRELIEWPEVARGARPGWLLPEFGEE